MTKEEYIDTLEVCGLIINVGIDWYGQSYFIEYEQDGVMHEEGCGTYNNDYIEYIYCRFDKKYEKLCVDEMFGELDEGGACNIKKYRELFASLYKRNELKR